MQVAAMATYYMIAVSINILYSKCKIVENPLSKS